MILVDLIFRRVIVALRARFDYEHPDLAWKSNEIAISILTSLAERGNRPLARNRQGDDQFREKIPRNATRRELATRTPRERKMLGICDSVTRVRRNN